mgnify:CR=1 FL=1|jgi:hypothetical protein
MNAKYLLIIIGLAFAGCKSTGNYEVHLLGPDDSSHHLITAASEDEALDFVNEYEESHGSMKIIKRK